LFVSFLNVLRNEAELMYQFDIKASIEKDINLIFLFNFMK